jgi:hypothetical protein
LVMLLLLLFLSLRFDPDQGTDDPMVLYCRGSMLCRRSSWESRWVRFSRTCRWMWWALFDTQYSVMMPWYRNVTWGVSSFEV